MNIGLKLEEKLNFREQKSWKMDWEVPSKIPQQQTNFGSIAALFKPLFKSDSRYLMSQVPPNN